MKAKLRVRSADQLRLERRKGLDSFGHIDLGSKRGLLRQIEIHREMGSLWLMQASSIR